MYSMSVVNLKVQGALNRQGEQTGVITSSVFRCVCVRKCVRCLKVITR